VGNPIHGRFDKYQPISEQFEFKSTLLSRFDLIYTVSDRPDYDSDCQLASHVLQTHNAEKRKQNTTNGPTQDYSESVSGPISDSLLTKWLALAKDQPAPIFANENLQKDLAERYAKFRVSSASDDSPVPIAARKLKAIVRLAEAAAKLEFSTTIEQRHIDLALFQTKESLKDVGMNEDGEFDADVIETGTSKPQRDRIESLADLIEQMDQDIGGNISVDDIVSRAASELGIDANRTEKTLSSLKTKKGYIYEPTDGEIRWMGRGQ